MTMTQLHGARCTEPDTDPDWFFPATPVEYERALRLCSACPVRAACLDEALRSGTSDGIWGGTLLAAGKPGATKRRPGRPRRAGS